MQSVRVVRPGHSHEPDGWLGRSAVLGVASYIADRTRSLMEVTRSDRVVLSGGSVANAGWVHLFTDLLGADVEVVRKVAPDVSRSSRARDVIDELSFRLSRPRHLDS